MQEYKHPEFVVADYVVFVCTILVSLGIGIYYAFSGGKQRTTSEYLVGNRHMRLAPVALSLMVSFESSIMMLGYPAEVYSYGAMFCLAIFGFMLSIILGGMIAVPLCHPLGIKSVNEYFVLRYKGRAVRLLGSGLGILYYIFYMGIVLFGPGTALEAVTDFPFWLSVISVAIASVAYTSVGGIKAVIWTDVFQSVIMFTGMLSILIKGTILAGGPKSVFEQNAENGRFNFFNFDTDPTVRHTVWTLVAGGAMGWLSMPFNQSTVQRISSMRKQKNARKLMLLAGPAFFVSLSLATLEGIVAFAYYNTVRCDPLGAGKIKNANQLIPYMVLDMFKNLPGMPGLFVASLFSASLSTLSSGLSSVSAMTVEDFVKPYYKLSDQKLTLIAKLSVPVYGVICIGISFMIAKIPGPMSQISASVLSAFAGPACGLFLFSVLFPWATKKGALIGTILSTILSFWLSYGKNFSKTLKKTPLAQMPPMDRCFGYNSTVYFNNFTTEAVPFQTTESFFNEEPQGVDKYYSLSYMYVAALGTMYTIFIGIIVSCIEGLPKSSDVDVRYVLPFFDVFCPYLPKTLRQKLYFGVPFEKREELLKTINIGVRDYEETILPPDNELKVLKTKDQDDGSLGEQAEDNNV